MAPTLYNMNTTTTKTWKDEIIDLADAHGGETTPEEVLDAAVPGTLLHSKFDSAGLWDDASAALVARLSYASHLLRRVTYTVEIDGKPRKVRKFQNVVVEGEVQRSDDPTERPKGKYLTIERVMGDERYREQLMRQCRADLRAFKNKYANLQEVAGLLESIDAAHAEIGAMLEGGSNG